MEEDKEDISFGTFSNKRTDFIDKAKRATALGISNKDVMKCYDEWAVTYDKGAFCDESYNPPKIGANAVAEIVSNRKDALILDAAAGTGLVGEQKMGFSNLDALDASQAMLNQARPKNIYNRLICDFTGPNKLHIQDDMYDAVVTVGSFTEGHVKHDCFPEMIRIIKRGGVFIMAMSEINLERCDAYRGILEPAMQALEDAGQWRRLKRERVKEFFAGKIGLLFVYKIL